MTGKLTEAKKTRAARRRALQWIADHEPVSLFSLDGSAPELSFVKKLRAMGLVEMVRKKPSRRFLALHLYRLTAAGHAALAEASPRTEGGTHPDTPPEGESHG